MPTLSADNNGPYGGSLINEKYSPLRSITIAAGDKDFYVNLFDERIKTLTRQNIFPTGEGGRAEHDCQNRDGTTATLY